MSNPTDPKKPNPDRPDPNTPTPPPSESGSAGSMFEFVLPDDFGELPPIPPPDAGASSTDFALPPAPPAPRATDSNPFGFGTGTGSHGSFGDFGLELPPPPAPEWLPAPAPDTNAFALPEPTGAAELPPPAPDGFALPSSDEFNLYSGESLLTGAEDLPSAEIELDLRDLPLDSESEVLLGDEPAQTDSAPSSFSLSSADLPGDVPVADEGALPPPPASSGSVPDVGDLRPATPASSGSTPELPPTPRVESFEFRLPDNVNTYSELPPIPEPDEIGSKGDFGALPPRPPAVPRDASFDFINVSGEGSAPELAVGGSAAGAAPPDGSKVGLGGTEPAEPVVPASGWLDAEPPPPAPVPEAETLDAPQAGAPDTSDIFSGGSVKSAELVESSDVLSATSGATPAAESVPPPDEPVRPSEVALTFNPAPGGSTLQDVDLDDLPLAEDAPDSGTEFAPPADDESIHDMPLPAEHPLFDSGPLANVPDLPPDADEADYGASPAFSPDASSILADLSAPDLGVDDASSVRVEAPGMDRTLGSEPEAAFDLTVPEGPVPAGMFDDADDTGSESAGWEEQSGSDLLAARTAPPGDEPVDVDLFNEDPVSSPSSIFSGAKSPVTNAPAGGETDLGESAEFTDRPLEPDATVTAPPLRGGGSTGSRPGAPRAADDEIPEIDVETGQIEFEVAEAGDADDQRTQAAPPGVPLSALMRGELPDDSEELSTRVTQERGPDPDDETRQPEVSLDYLSDSNEESALPPPVSLQKPPTKSKDKSKDKTKAKKGYRPPEPEEEAPAKTKVTKSTKTAALAETGAANRLPGKKGSGLLVGALFGAVVAGGAWAGLYFGDVIPNSKPGTVANGTGTKPPPNGTTPGGTDTQPPAAFDPNTAFAAGEATKAVEHYKAHPPANLTEKTDAGHALVFAKAQGLEPGATAPADDAGIAAARKDLEDVIADAGAVADKGGVKRGVKASVALGTSYELTGDLKAARKVYADAMQRYPAYKGTFEALIDRLDALAPPAPTSTSRRITPADAQLLLATVVLLQPAQQADEVEPGVYYWKAVKAANAGSYKDALEQIEKAKEAHLKQAPAFSGRGVNALSDPRQQIFAKTCDELKAYWKLRGAVSGNPDMIAEIKKDGGALAKALDSFAKAAEAVTKAEKEATAARETVKKLEGEVARLDKDAVTFNKIRVDLLEKQGEALRAQRIAEKKFDAAAAELKLAAKDVETRQTALVSLADVLKPVTPVPDKWSPADLLAATKAVIARATGPDLKALVPNAMTAIGGGGLAAGQLIEIAERLNKAETTAKDAIAKLMTETKKLKDDHTAEVKKLTDGYTADIKKLNDTHTEAVRELKAGSSAELKKLTDKYAADSKKLTDDYAAAVTKLKEESATALKVEQAKTETEKKRAVARELEFQKQLANAVTPGQVMDLWIPVLTDLRRVSDTGPALTAAQKTVAGSTPDSEDAAKGRTVAGLAYLIRGDLAKAEDMFRAARRSPAYKEATGKPWVVAADTGLEAVTDPSAPFRQPVTMLPVDLKAAASSLDAGIVAYKNARYDAAVKALLDAAKNNPADPVAWYFLGAARWGQGNEEQAKKDFAQGAEREKASILPSRTTSDALAPIQGAGRDAIDRVRP